MNILNLNTHLGLAICVTLAGVIVIREACLAVATYLGMPSVGNILGMIVLFVALIVWRMRHGLPTWLLNASNKILTESALAYLPVCAGAGLLLFKLGSDFWAVMLVTVLATVPPLWILAKLADYWLHRRVDGRFVDDSSVDDGLEDCAEDMAADAKQGKREKQNKQDSEAGV